MKKNGWDSFVDIITLIWITVFLYSIIIKYYTIEFYCNIAMLLLLPVFVVDLVLIYKSEKNFKSFIQNKWLDVLLAIPYFRIFRLLKLAKLLRFLKIIKFKKAVRYTQLAKKTTRIVK